ncbi:unnamed protein product [Lasius platythorax]|uniref:Uncharacterized protein n=1 Tax=Lasius platythorax TaxID=488582 RepID=A0AAV2MZU2_9HYME
MNKSGVDVIFKEEDNEWAWKFWSPVEDVNRQGKFVGRDDIGEGGWIWGNDVFRVGSGGNGVDGGRGGIVDLKSGD